MKSPSKDKRFQYQPGKVMRAARRTAGITVEAVAVAVHVSADHLLEMEKGVRVSSPAQWFLFCELMKIPEDSYFEGYNKKQHQITLGLPERQIQFSRFAGVTNWIRENCLGRLKTNSDTKSEGDVSRSASKAAVIEVGSGTFGELKPEN